MRPRYKISVLTLQGRQLSFKVNEYNIVDDGVFIEFVDEFTGNKKRFHTSRCEIELVKEDQHG